jgi:hypothetical protein
MRRLYLRGRDNVAKRVLIHAAGFNIGLMMRVHYGLPKPRSGSATAGAARAPISALVRGLRRLGDALGTIPAIGRRVAAIFGPSPAALAA